MLFRAHLPESTTPGASRDHEVHPGGAHRAGVEALLPLHHLPAERGQHVRGVPLRGVTALYVSTCAAVGRRRSILVALCNAAGALVGFTAFAILVERHGVEWVRDRHPEILASKHWSRAESAMETFGPAGVGPQRRALPLHPLVLVAMLAGMRKETVLAAVFPGRLVKYTVFGWLATSGSNVLSRLGVKSAAVADTPEAKKTR